MKKWKAVLALLLVAALCLALFAACAKTETPAKTDEPAKTDTTPAKTDEPAKTEEPAKTDEPAPADEPEEKSLVFEEGEVRDFKMVYFDLRMVAGDHGERVQEAINDYIVPKYGLRIDLDYYTIGDWMTKIMVALAGGERVDFMPYLFSTSITNMYAQNMAMQLDDLVAEYAPEAMELMAPYVDAYRLNGKLYGFPILKNWVTNGYICMRKDILEELGMLELGQNLDNLDDYEKIMAAVHDNYTATTGLYAISKEAGRSVTPSNLWNGRKFSDVETYENAGDSTGTVMILSDGSNKVTWAQDDPRTEEKLTWVKKWRDNGWVWPDSALTDTHGDELMKQGVSFSVLTGSEIGIEVTKGANIGKEVVCPKYYTGMISTSGVQTWGMGIPATAEEPEAGAYFMNILFTDPVVMNLITWGVEGEDYDLVDGQVKTREGMYYESDFIMGNNLLLKPIYGNGANHYENVAADIAAAKNSEYLGFALDLNPLQDYIANISAVNDQYTPDLYTGNYTPEKYASYKAALETGGVHDYLDAVQKQLDAWLAGR